jgi:hypothetical protein
VDASSLLLIGAALTGVAALAYWLRNRQRPERPLSPRRYLRVRGRARRSERRGKVLGEPPTRSPALIALGLSLMLATLGLGVLLLGEEEREIPEQRGIGVVTSVHPNPGRGVALSAGVRFRSCDEPVDVTLVATGTTEFWLDQARRLRQGGTVRLAIPGRGLRDVGIRLGRDGKTAPLAPMTEREPPDARSRLPASELVPMPVRELRSVTVVGARIPRWGQHLRPVVVEFEADWLDRRTHLGSCFLSLPALTGFSTVLSAQEVLGRAVEDVNQLEGPSSIFVVSSEETGLEAYYSTEYEITRGVTSVSLGSSSMRGELSAPGPDANVRGATSWTCSSTPPKSAGILETVSRGENPEIVEGAGENATGALSTTRLGTAVGARTCASYAVIDEPKASVNRDFTLLLVGAVFSIGVGVALDGLRRKPRRR